MVSGIITALLLGLFLIGTVWAFSPKRKGEFEAAAALPFEYDALRHDALQDDAHLADDAVEEMPR